MVVILVLAVNKYSGKMRKHYSSSGQLFAMRGFPERLYGLSTPRPETPDSQKSYTLSLSMPGDNDGVIWGDREYDDDPDEIYWWEGSEFSGSGTFCFPDDTSAEDCSHQSTPLSNPSYASAHSGCHRGCPSFKSARSA